MGFICSRLKTGLTTFVNNAAGNFSPKEILKVIWPALIGQKKTSSVNNVKEGT